jgi:hypothetical protein
MMRGGQKKAVKKKNKKEKKEECLPVKRERGREKAGWEAEGKGMR